MAIKNTDKIVVLDSSVDTTERRSRLINERSESVTLNDLAGAMQYSSFGCKAYEVTVPIVSAASTETLSIDLGAIGNPDAVILGVTRGSDSIEDIEKFDSSVVFGYKYIVSPNNTGSTVTPVLTTKYQVNSGYSGLGTASRQGTGNFLFRVSEDYNKSGLGLDQSDATFGSKYDDAGTFLPAGFTYGDIGVGVLAGWWVYNGNKGFAEIAGKLVLQGSWIEQDGDNTTLKLVLSNVDAAADTVSTDIKIVRFL